MQALSGLPHVVQQLRREGLGSTAAALEAAAQLREEVKWGSLHRLIGAARQLQQAILSLPSGHCTGPDCCYHSLADATRLVFNRAVGIKPAAIDAPAGDSTSTDRQDQRQQQRQQLYCRVQAQQLCELAPMLLSACKQLLTKGHSDGVVLEMANTFYRCVLLLLLLDPSDLRGRMQCAGACCVCQHTDHSRQADTPANAAVP
jgi:hypothetical protein